MQRPRVLFMSLAVVYLAAVAAWGEELRAETPQLRRTATALTTAVNALHHHLDETIATVEGLSKRVVRVEAQIASFLAAAEVHALDRTAGIPDPPAGQVALSLGFQYLPKPLPGQGIQAYEPTAEVQSLWAMESLPHGQPVPKGAAIEANTLFLAPGESRMVTLVYENPTAQDVGFLVLPHQEAPGSLAPMVWPTCLCMSFVYTAPAQGRRRRCDRIGVEVGECTGSKWHRPLSP